MLTGHGVAADLKLAQHWRAQTVRLANTRVKHRYLDNTFHAQNLAFREAKAKEFAQARYADTIFQCLLAERGPMTEESLISLYQENAELAVKIAAAQPAMEWRLLKDVPTTFERTSPEIETVSSHGLFEKERRLNGRRVLAVVTPVLRKTGTWADFGKDRVMCKGRVIVDDPSKRPPINYWDPGKAKAERKKAREEKRAREEKKAREEKEKAEAEGAESADGKESSPKGKTRKGGKTRT